MTSKRGVFALAIAIALLAAIPVAGAAPSRTPTGPAWGSSCIDGNNNGQCGESGDIPMAQALGSVGYYNDAASKNSGVVLQGTVTITSFVMIIVKGNLTVRGAVTIKTDEGVQITSTQGNIAVADNASISSSNGSFVLETYGKGNSAIGNGVKLKEIAGSMWDALTIHAAGNLSIGSTNAYSGGGDYGTVTVRADETLTVAPGLKFTGPNHSILELYSGTTLVIDKLTHKAGYLFLQNGTKNSYLPSNATAVVYDMTIRSSSIQQTYRNGELWLTNKGKLPQSRIYIYDSKITAATDDPHAFPLADCFNTTAPQGICK